MKQPHKRPAAANAANRALERVYELAVVLTGGMDRGLGGQGLSRPRAELLWTLHRAGPMTQRDLSDRLRCTPRNVTGLVDALEAGGLISRRPHPTDRRATLVTLTAQGAAVGEAWEAGYRDLAGALFGDMSEREVKGFLATVERLLERLTEVDESA